MRASIRSNTVLPDAERVLTSYSLVEATRSIRSGRLSPVQLTEHCIERVHATENALHAFATFTPDAAREAARRSERELADGIWRGPLHGVPVGFKDVIDLAGLPTRGQSSQLDGSVATGDAPAARRWLDGGAISLGKLTTHEFAFGAPSETPDRAARNPWRPAHFTGGSSSGAGAGVASGMLFGALGTDTAGSVRSPAALCGVTGFKPGRSTIDRRGCVPLAPTLDAHGVIGRSAEDCALLYAACAEPAGAARIDTSADGLPCLDADVRGLRVGMVRNFWRDATAGSHALESAVETACAVFARLGCSVSDVTLPALEDWNAAGFVILLSEAFSLHERWLRERPWRYGEAFADAVLAGAAFDAADYVTALGAMRALNGAFDEAMTHFDLLIAPIQPDEAPPFEAVTTWGFLQRPSFGIPFNLTDSPALSLCCGFGPQGLPLGLQLVGKRGAEQTVLLAAHRYQSSTDWHRHLPPVP